MIFTSAAPPVIQFLQSLLLGVLLAFLYDIFYAVRSLFPVRIQPHIVLDILYFLLFGIILFNYLLMESAGRLRYFIVLGVIIGWVVYHNTVSRLAVRFLGWLFGFIRRILNFLFRPFLALWKHICGAFSAVRKKYAARHKSRKNCLKNPLALLYNKVSKSDAEGEQDEKSSELQPAESCSDPCDRVSSSAHRRFLCKGQGTGGTNACRTDRRAAARHQPTGRKR